VQELIADHEAEERGEALPADRVIFPKQSPQVCKEKTAVKLDICSSYPAICMGLLPVKHLAFIRQYEYGVHLREPYGLYCVHQFIYKRDFLYPCLQVRDKD
jgi:hypothetical protein